jgi:hypothetical protein
MNDSSAKKLDFSPVEKENTFKPIVGIPDDFEDDLDAAKPTVAPTIKEEEAIEPILQENPGRFVLFPIKYHDVSFTLWCSHVLYACINASNTFSSKPLLITHPL